MVSKTLGGFCEQVRILNGGGINGDFFGTASQELVDLVNCLDAAAYGERDEDVFGDFFDELDDCFARANGGGDVEEDQLIGAFITVSCAELDGVAGIAEIQEMDAFDNTVVFNIETRDDSFCKHQVVFL